MSAFMCHRAASVAFLCQRTAPTIFRGAIIHRLHHLHYHLGVSRTYLYSNSFSNELLPSIHLEPAHRTYLQTSPFMDHLPDQKLSHLPDGGTSCYICQKMQDRKPAWRQTGGTNICKLCDNHYCDTHKNHNIDHVCEMNHDTYCRKQRHREDHAPTHIFRNLAEREQWIAQYGTKNVAGVFQGF